METTGTMPLAQVPPMRRTCEVNLVCFKADAAPVAYYGTNAVWREGRYLCAACREEFTRDAGGRPVETRLVEVVDG